MVWLLFTAIWVSEMYPENWSYSYLVTDGAVVVTFWAHRNGTQGTISFMTFLSISTKQAMRWSSWVSTEILSQLAMSASTLGKVIPGGTLMPRSLAFSGVRPIR